MLIFNAVDAWSIDISRGDNVIGYITNIANEFDINLLVYRISSSELRQIADKLDELNGVNNDK